MRLEEILGTVIEFPFFMFVILTLSKPRYTHKTTLITAAAVAAPYMLVSYWIILNFHYVIYAYPALDLAYRVVNILLMALTALCLTRQRFVQGLFLIASTYVTITVIDVLAVACLLSFNLPEVAAKSVLYLITSLLIYRARKPFTGILAQTKKGWWLLCSVPLFLIVNFLLISAIPVTLSQNPGGMPAALILCGTTIIIYITFFYMMWEARKQNQLEQNVMALSLSVSALEQQNGLIQQIERQNALFRHDLRHFAGMIHNSLDQADIPAARVLLASLTQNAVMEQRDSPVPVYTGYKLLDALITRYTEQAREADTQITVRTDLLESINADITELAVVLANALENAVTACRTLPDDQPRIIRLDGRRRGAQYFLEIANTSAKTIIINKETGLPDNGSTRRGLGCQSIAFFAQKYNAALQFVAEDGWFHIRMLL